MAEAARQTILTLQEINNQKSAQLERKEQLFANHAQEVLEGK